MIREQLDARGVALIDHLMDWNCYAEEDAAYYRCMASACRNIHGGLPEDWMLHTSDPKDVAGK